MSRKVSEVDKDLTDFKQQISEEIGRIKARLEVLEEADVVDSKANKDVLESVESELEALRDSLPERFEKLEEKLETKMRERIEEKVNAAKENMETKHNALKERVGELKGDTTQGKTWSLSKIAIVISSLALIGTFGTLAV